VILLPHDQFLAWGWRLPFLFSIVLVVFGILIRRGIDETPIFLDLAKSGRAAKSPLLTTFKNQPGAIIRTMGVTISGFIWGYLIQSFGISYAVVTLKIDPGVTLWAVTCASVLEIVAIPFWGWTSDKIGRKKQIIAGLILISAYAFPFFVLLGTKSTPLIFLAIFIAIPILKDIVFGPQAAFVAEMFDSRVRYSGISAGREIGGAIFGGTAPFIGTALVAVAGGFWPVALYVIFGCALTAWATAATKNQTGKELATASEIQTEVPVAPVRVALAE
jgi:MHS family shikimate/dehydroshikimate transporter-like MFS transporter